MGEECSIHEAVKRLYAWQYGDCTSFSSKLFSLMQKADSINTLRLTTAFPVHYKAFSEWRTSGDTKKYFAKYGF